MTNVNDRAARKLFLSQSYGVLSTISVDVRGYPFGSVTPYCLDREGRPILHTTFSAQRTKNVRANPKVSRTVVEATDGAGDVQAQGRVTCLGNIRQVQDVAGSDLADKYFRYVPSARQYAATHDFAFFLLEP